MKYTQLCAMVSLAFLVSTFIAFTEPPHAKIGIKVEPAVSLKEALNLAEQYLADKPVNVSDYFLESVALVPRTGSGPLQRVWLVT